MSAKLRRVLLWVLGAVVALAAVIALLFGGLIAYMDHQATPELPERTITQQQATDRLREYLRNAASQLDPAPRLEPLGGLLDVPCTDGLDRPTGQVDVREKFWLRDLPRERHAEYLDTLFQYWSTNGFRVDRDRRGGSLPEIWVRHPQDGFVIGLETGGDGTLILRASSPCVWPKGMPEPSR